MDGADAVMLSGETSVGNYPVEVLETMTRIIESVEDSHLIKVPLSQPQVKTNVILPNRFVTTLLKWRILLMRKRLLP